MLDRFFEAIGANFVFTVRPEFADLIYPRTRKIATFENTFAGFLNDEDIARVPIFAKDFDSRDVTLGQRVTLYPAVGGKLARLKGEAALAMKAAAIERGVTEDISVDPQNIFLGDAWYKFLGNCKFVIGAEGGLGVWDPDGSINDAVRAYTERNPEASFEEIEAACFPGLDGNPEFPGFSPRILEAALLGCCQILVEGHYRGILKPFEHYIPLKRDFSNFREVFVLMRDRALVDRLISNSFRDLVESDRFRYATLVNRVIGIIEQSSSERGELKFNHLPFEERFPIAELTATALKQGFGWPRIAERVADQIAAQQLPEVSDFVCANDVKTQAKYRVFDVMMQIVGGQKSDEAESALVSTMTMLGVDAHMAAAVASLLSDARHSDLARFAQAATRDTALAGLTSRLAPGAGTQFTPAEVARLEQIDRLIVSAGEGGLDQLEDFLARRDQAGPLMSVLADGGDTARFLIAVAGDRQSLAGLSSRLAPRSGEAFGADEIARLQRLDELVVRTAETGLDALFRQLAHGARAEKLLAALERGGDTARLILALAGGEAGLIGIASRLAPVAGEVFSAGEVLRLQQLDSLIVNAGARPLDEVVSDMVTEPERQCLVGLRAHPDMGEMVHKMLQMRARLELLSGQVAPANASAGIKLDASGGASPDVTRAGFQVLSAVVGPRGKSDEQIKAAAEVLDWPSSGLALLVIEASSRSETDPIAASKNVDTLRRVGQVFATGGIRSSLIGLIVGRNSKRND